jgi:hypothetical protein
MWIVRDRLHRLEAQLWPRSPVMTAELLHLSRAGEAAASGRSRLLRIVSGMAALGVVLLLGSIVAALVVGTVHRAQVGAQWWRNPTDLEMLTWTWVMFGRSMIGLFLLFDHIFYAASAIRSGAGALAREKANGSYDLLRLTLQTPRAIVLGKWRAAVQAYVAPSRSVFLLRMAFVLVLCLTASYESNWVWPIVLIYPAVLWAVPVFRGIAGAYIAAVAVACSALTRDEAAAVRLAWAVLVCVHLAVGFAMFCFITTFLIGTALASGSGFVTGSVGGFFSILVPLDAGLTMLLASLSTFYAGETVGILLTGVLVAALVFGPIALLALWVASAQVRGGG